MTKQALPHSQDICQKLLRGYQFSDSDLEDLDMAPLYNALDTHFQEFQDILEAIGFSLVRDGDVIFLQKEEKTLSNEEKQSIVVLYLFVDLWTEKGKPYGDLYQFPVPWRDLDWFRDGYGREYLAQVGIENGDITAIEDLFRRLARKGLVEYHQDTSTVTFRNPTKRLINMAQRIHHIMKDNNSAQTQ